jgi:hypothetical protein
LDIHAHRRQRQGHVAPLLEHSPDWRVTARYFAGKRAAAAVVRSAEIAAAAARDVAATNIAGQVALSERTASRLDRSRRLAQSLDLANARTGLYLRWLSNVLATGNDGTARVHQFSLWENTSFRGIDNQRLHEAINAFLSADRTVDSLLSAPDRPWRDPVWAEQVQVAIAVLSQGGTTDRGR